MLNDGQRLLRINMNDVAFLEAQRVCCKMHMRDGKTIHTLSAPLGTVERSLPEYSFVRIHRSFVINIRRIHMIMGRMVVLDSGQRFTLGEQYLHALDDRLLIIGK